MDSLDDGIAGPMWPAVAPLTLVAVTVGRDGHPLAIPLVVLPLAVVAIAVGGREGSLAVPLPLAHLSHVLGNDAVVEPLHGPATGSATVRATTSAPCYNFTGLGGLIPDPTAGSGVDRPAWTIRSGQRVRRRRGRPC